MSRQENIRASIDAKALEILLAPISDHERRKRLLALERQATQALGLLCPSCDSTDTEDNGETGSRQGFRCRTCDHRWGPDNEND